MPCKLLARAISQQRWIHGTILWSPGCKQYIRNKTVTFGNKFWVAAIPLGYAIQFYLYVGKDENYDSNLGFGGSVAAILAKKLQLQVGSNYRIIMGNVFTSQNLLRILKAKSNATTRTVRINRVENAPLRPIEEMEKLERGASDVADACSMDRQQSGNKIVYICWKNAAHESSSLCESSKWQGWDWPSSKYVPI